MHRKVRESVELAVVHTFTNRDVVSVNCCCSLRKLPPNLGNGDYMSHLAVSSDKFVARSLPTLVALSVLAITQLSGCVVRVVGPPPPPPPVAYSPPPPPPPPAPAYAPPEDQGEVQASEAPPPLPDYEQPPCPDEGYLWTPGYWAFAPGGYYWVPGTWVLAPTPGYLWTPAYWGWENGFYIFHGGYWGPHIGFYGGINYGFGYVGFGYEGGYWNSGRFFYNRVYNRLNTRVVHNVYSYNASDRARGVSRTSFNGGSRGVQVRPQPSEVAASREPTAPRMSTQVQHAQSYSSARGQLATQNHGRPATPAISRPLRADRNVTPTTSHGR
jgi:hypothetical protein